MILLTVTMPENFNLFLFSDDHEGSAMRHDEGWNKMLNHINSSIDGLPILSNAAVDHGDFIEGLTVDHPYYDPSTFKYPDKPLPFYQAARGVANRIPISQQLKVMLRGNHDGRFKRIGDLAHMCVNSLRHREDSPVQYGTWSCKVSWLDTRGEIMFKSFHAHGIGARTLRSTADDPKRRVANEQLMLKRRFKAKHADTIINAMGDTHRLIVAKPESELFLYDDGEHITQGYTHWEHGSKYIHPDARFYINTGSFLKMYSDKPGIVSYAEERGYDPIELGYVLVKVRERKIHSAEKVVLGWR